MRCGGEIRADHYTVGSRLPGELELAARFQVSPGTVRQALRLLVEEGTLGSQRGARKVVLRMPPRFPGASKFRSFAQWAFSQGRRPGGQVKQQQWVAATAMDVRYLRVPIGSAILAVGRVRTIDGDPVMYERTRYPEWIGLKVEPLNPGCDSVTNELLRRHGIKFFAADHVFSADGASVEDAEFLPLQVGDPMLVHRRVSRDLRGVPLEMGEDRYLSRALGIAVPTTEANNSLSWTMENGFPWD